jgi:uroporphyrinogen-III synthase
MSAPSSDSDRVLAGKVVAVPEARQLDVLASLLERRGASVLRCPLVGIVDSPDEAAVLAWIERLIATPTDLAVFYTGEGIQRLVAFARRADREAPFVAALARTPKLTRGPKPKRALKSLELEPEYEGVEPTTAGMIEAAQRIAAPLRRVALQLYSQEQDRQLADWFAERGAAVDPVAPYAYASKADDERVAALIEELTAGRVDAIAFTSKAQVQRLLELAEKRRLEEALRSGLERTKVAAIGPVVAAELEHLRIRVDAMPEDSYSMKPLVTSVCELLRGAR